MPFEILVYYLKNAKHILTPIEKNFLDDLLVLSINAMCQEAKFFCYFINSSDVIDILMSDICC